MPYQNNGLLALNFESDGDASPVLCCLSFSDSTPAWSPVISDVLSVDPIFREVEEMIEKAD